MTKSDEELNVWEEGGCDLIANHHVGDGGLELHDVGSLRQPPLAAFVFLCNLVIKLRKCKLIFLP